MYPGSCILLLLLLSAPAFSSPHGLKTAPQLLTSQFLSADEVSRTIERLENGDKTETAELLETEERSEDGLTMLKLKSSNREIELELQPSYRLIAPEARVNIIEGDNEHEEDFDLSLRSSFFHGSVSGSPSGLASLVKNEHGWNGMIQTSEQRFLLHGLQDSTRSILVPMSTEDEAVYNGQMFDLDQRSKEYNMSGDESFTRASDSEFQLDQRSQEYNMSGDESFTRASDSEFQLEIGVYTDEDLYKFVQKKYPRANTKQKVQEVALITLNTVHTFYQKPSIGNKIAVVVASMNVMTSNPSGLRKAYNMGDYLDNYCNWDADNKNPGGAKYDFGLLFSGIDMYSGNNPSNTGTAGMAPVSRTCLHNTKRSCAIGEAIGFGAGIIMAHEIGHNLGMLHDSSGNSCPGKGYIMGAMISAGATKFSSCSRDYLRKYLKSLDDFGLNCMRDKGNAAMEHSVSGQLPGERLPKGEQCRYAVGDGWTEYTDKQGFCAQLYCTQGGGGWRSPNGGPPLPGTPCGSGKVCWDGQCSNRDYVVNQIKAYTPTKSGSSGTARPLTELCQQYGNGYRTPVTYDNIQNVNINFGDVSSMCSQGMLCRNYNQLMRLQYVAPPGTSCAAGKVCKNYSCGSGSSSSSGSGNSGSSGSGNSGSGNSGSGNSGSGNSGNKKTVTPAHEKFCRRMKGSSAKGKESSDCSRAQCTVGNMIYTIPVYSANICPTGQICNAGKCTRKNNERVEGALSGAMMRNVKTICRNANGSRSKPLCTKINLLMHPRLSQYCSAEFCQYVMCIQGSGGRWSFRSAYTPEGTSCGNGKTCHWYECQ